MSSPTLAGRKLVQAAFTVTDLARSVAFYRDVLGFPLMFETNGMAFFQAGFQAGDLRLMIGTNSPDPPARGTVLYFDAPDIDDLAPALEAKGVEFIGPIAVLQRTEAHELKLRIFRDPDGNPIGLMGMVPR
jgi:catechol 2,3-dioxygenase-like lactoylglutathione lyase family enzyme